MNIRKCLCLVNIYHVFYWYLYFIGVRLNLWEYLYYICIDVCNLFSFQAFAYPTEH